MTEKFKIAVIDDDCASREVFRSYVEGHALYQPVCAVCSSEEAQGVGADFYIIIGEGGVSGIQPFAHFPKPVRIGAVGDVFERLIKKQNRSAVPDKISIGSWMLDVLHNVLISDASGDEVRLTEKEKEILVFLHKHTGQSVSRENLLHAVWGYAKDIETHTLETHIYRLRQKIENDSAEPEILLTTETGYILKVN